MLIYGSPTACWKPHVCGKRRITPTPAASCLALIRRHEIAQAGSAGPVLLPGPVGFQLDKGRFWLNPSYYPDFMFRYLAAADPKGPWQSVWDSYMRMTPKVFSAGVAPDLFVVDSTGQGHAGHPA